LTEESEIHQGNFIAIIESDIGPVARDQIRNQILEHFPGNCVPVKRVRYDAVNTSDVTPSFRSVWSVFGDVSGMGGLIGPVCGCN
jgi:hypothetical protein